jgi:hypothetical protein
MNANALGALVLNELRLRARRVSSLVCLFVVMVLIWTFVVDPASGRSLMVIGKRAVTYNSEALALGTSVIASFLFGMFAFYLARGRTREDLQCGVAGVLAASPISNVSLILARWAGAMAFLLVLVAGLMVTMLALQAVRGVSPIEPLVFARTYLLMLLPTLVLAASVAVAADSYAPLMGKGGDLLYFGLWFGQFGVLPVQLSRVEQIQSVSIASLFDVSGMLSMIARLIEMFNTRGVSIGGGVPDRALAPILLNGFWTWEMVLLRLATTLLAMLPLILAVAWFHRYSPDKVRATPRGSGKGLWAWANRMASPAARLIRPAFAMAQRLPGIAGQCVADAALALSANPLLFLALLILFVAGWWVSLAALLGVTFWVIAVWGVMVSDLAARDAQSGTDTLSAAAPGGALRRFARQLSVTYLIGMVAVSPAFFRWLAVDPVTSLTLAIGLAMLAACATLLARLTRGGRTFLGLFLLGLYLSAQLKAVRWFDAFGLYAAADGTTRLTYFAAALTMIAAGWLFTQRTLK